MLRDVIEADLPIFYEQQLDPESTRMAAFAPREEWTVFLTHWRTKVLGVPTCRCQTIVWNDRVAGYVASWLQEERRMIAYWIGREYWGRGIATAALAEFLGQDRARPLHAYVAAHNEKGKPFRWTKTADEILDKMRRFALRTQQVHA